jgi:hypothetical protein
MDCFADAHGESAAVSLLSIFHPTQKSYYINGSVRAPEQTKKPLSINCVQYCNNYPILCHTSSLLLICTCIYLYLDLRLGATRYPDSQLRSQQVIGGQDNDRSKSIDVRRWSIVERSLSSAHQGAAEKGTPGYRRMAVKPRET